jgi:hypothetical protein
MSSFPTLVRSAAPLASGVARVAAAAIISSASGLIISPGAAAN